MKDHKPQSTVFLKGKKTVLRPVQESDLPLFQRWLNDPEVREFLKGVTPITSLIERRWYERTSESKNDVVLVITLLDGTPIGVMGIHRISWTDRVATTGAFIGEKRYWGKGYGTDAKMQLLNYAFNTLNLRKMCSRAVAFNKRSIAYSLHCGYVQEGVLRSHTFKNGEYHDLVELGLFKEEWLPYWNKYRKKS